MFPAATVGISAKELGRFQRAIEAHTVKQSTIVVRAVEKTLFDMLADIIRLTPVDTGRARAGWTAFHERMGAPVEVGGDGTGVAAGKAESATKVNLPAVVRPGNPKDMRPFGEVTNSVRHILPLEFGWSRQGSAMVRVSVRAHSRKLRAVLGSI